MPDNPIPCCDGMAGVISPANGDILSIDRWDATGPAGSSTHSETWRSSDRGQTWTLSNVTKSYQGCHSTPVVPFNGRLYQIGCDGVGGTSGTPGYDNRVKSWDGAEYPTSTGWRVDATLASLNRVGHFGFALGGQLCFGGGQTFTWISSTPAPTKVLTDLICSPDGTTWTQVTDTLPAGIHGFISSASLPIIGSEAIAWSGGIYATADIPNRLYNGMQSIVAIGGPPTFTVRLLSGYNAMPPLFYNSTAVMPLASSPSGQILLTLAGHNGNNLQSVWASFDGGRTVSQLTNFPGTPMHAASVAVVGNEMVTWGGTKVTPNSKTWHLNDSASIHLGAPANGTTNLGSVYTICDRTNALTPGKAVKWLRLYMNGSHAVRPKIARENPTNYDFVFNGTSAQHPGGGYADFSGGNYVVPSDGFNYRVCFAMSFTPGVPDAFSFGGSAARSQAAGDLSGSSVTLTAMPDAATIPVGWTEN